MSVPLDQMLTIPITGGQTLPWDQRLLQGLNNPLMGMAIGLAQGAAPGGTLAGGMQAGLQNMLQQQRANQATSLMAERLAEMQEQRRRKRDVRNNAYELLKDNPQAWQAYEAGMPAVAQQLAFPGPVEPRTQIAKLQADYNSGLITDEQYQVGVQGILKPPTQITMGSVPGGAVREDGAIRYLPGSKEYIAAQAEVDSLAEMVGLIKEQRELVAKHGSEMWGTVAGEMGPKYNRIISIMGQLTDAGVLQEGERRALEDRMTDPTSARGLRTTRATMDAQMAEVEDQIQTRLDAARERYRPWGIGTDPTLDGYMGKYGGKK